MTLYNMLFGTNTNSNDLLKILGLTPDQVPRYRDCFLNDDSSMIVIHTRTGGGNRDYYESEESCRNHYPEYFNGKYGDETPTGPWNSDLRNVPGFIGEEDCDFDSTYANFYFEIPAEFKAKVEELFKEHGPADPAKMWDAVFKALEKKD